MSEETKNELIDAANDLHNLFYKLQNSGDVPEFDASELTMKADGLRERMFELFEKWEML